MLAKTSISNQCLLHHPPYPLARPLSFFHNTFIQQPMQASQKVKLKEEAKQLLLKGCYKMAMNKYLRLISMGGEGFAARDWAIVHLNTAICLQFQDKLDEALEKVGESIRIDPTYEKAYYRRLQILEEQGNFKAALHDNIVPAFIQNEEIRQLRDRIIEQYTKTLGLSSLLQKLQDKNFMENLGDDKNCLSFVQGAYESVFEAIVGEVDKQGKLREAVQVALSEHYVFLKTSSGHREWVQIFCHGMRKLLHVYSQQKIENRLLLQQFWKLYGELHCLKQTVTLFSIQHDNDEQNSLLGYYPCLYSLENSTFASVLNHALSLPPEKINIDLCLKFLQANQSTLMLQSLNVKDLVQIRSNGATILFNLLNSINFQLYERMKILINVIFQMVPQPHKQQQEQIKDFKSAYQFSRTKQAKPLNTLLAVQSYLKSPTFNTFADAQLSLQMLESVPLQTFSDNKRVAAALSELIIAKMKNEKRQIVEPSDSDKFLIDCTLLSMVIMADPIRDLQQEPTLKAFLIHLSSVSKVLTILCSQKSASVNSKLTIYLKTIAMAASTHNIVLLQLYSQLQGLASIFEEVNKSSSSESKKQKREPCCWILQLRFVQSAIRLLYLLVIDHTTLQEEEMADKMGVSASDISKTRKLQGQRKQNQQQLNSSRSKCIRNICASQRWSMILITLVREFNQINTTATATSTGLTAAQKQMTCIMKELAVVDHRRFYHPSIVKLVLGACRDPSNKYNAGIFLSKLAKVSNPNMFQYKDIQAIVDILVYVVKEGKHELHIFEGMLALISLSSATIKVDISVIEDALLQDNQYIVHSGMQLLNNMLITYGQDGQGSGLNKLQYLTKISQRIALIIHKYYLTYRQQILTTKKPNPNLNDYSHPIKVYATLISILMIIDEMKPLLEANSLKLPYNSCDIKQLGSWQEAERVLQIPWARQADLSMTLFKLAMHHCQVLPGKWHAPYTHWIGQLRETDMEKWSRLQRYIR